MIRSSRFLFFCFIVPLFAQSVSAEIPSSTQAPKLHPLLSAVLSSHASVFRGAPVFDAQGENAEEIGVIIYTSDVPALRAAGIRVQSVVENFATARIRVPDLETLVNLPTVQWVDPGSVCTLLTDVSVPMSGAPLLWGGYFNSTSYTGKGAIVLVQDSGIDFKHLDFRNPDDTLKSRILTIWDQTLSAKGAEHAPDGLTYGVEYTKEQIEAEFASNAPGFVREKDTEGHGTHVTGTAAGNGLSSGGMYKGMAPDADIIFVKGNTEAEMVDALTYAEKMATKFGKPISFNWSLGYPGPGNGSNPEEVAADNFMKKAGRVVCVAAGNSGNTNYHKGGSIQANTSDTISIIVPEYTPDVGTGGDCFILGLYITGAASNALSAAVISPRGVVVSMPAHTSADSSDGAISLSWRTPSTSQPYYWLSLGLLDANGKNPRPGVWKWIIRNNSASTIVYHGWPNNRSVGGKLVTIEGSDNAYTIGPPATSRSVISVGAYISKWDWPSISGQYAPAAAEEPVGDITTYTSQGPTTDGRQKPDLTAPGSDIVSTLSINCAPPYKSMYIAPDNKHLVMGGTSMAAPHVAGACALLLGADPSLTADALKSILQASATTDGYTAARSSYVWGSGKLDIARAMALLQSPSSQLTRTVISYDSAGSGASAMITNGMKAALRFTPPCSGTLTEAIIRTVPRAQGGMTGKGDVVCRLYTATNGVPGVPMGNEIRRPLVSLNPGTYNYLSLVGKGFDVETAKDYVLVVSLSDALDTLIVETDHALTNNRSLTYSSDAGWKTAGSNYRIRVELSFTQTTADVAVRSGVSPSAFELKQNYPNPFNPTTTITYTLPSKSRVKLAVLDVLGKTVAVLADGDEAAGVHRVVWNGRTSQGFTASSGVYFYRLVTNGAAQARTMVLMK